MRLLLLLLAVLTAAPALAQTTRSATAFYDAPKARPGQRGAPALEHRQYTVSVVLDGDEGLEATHDFELWAAPRTAIPEWVPVAVIDQALGDRCDSLTVEGNLDVDVQLGPAPPGFSHFGMPALCSVGPVPARSTRLTGRVLVTRPPQPVLDSATAWVQPVQPLSGAARSYRLVVEGSSEASARVLPVGWTVEVASEEISRERWRWSVDLEGVRILDVQPGQLSNLGRAPHWSIGTAGDWTQTSQLHRRVLDAAAEAHGPVLPLAGRVLGIRDPLDAVKEAVRIALGTITLEADGGGGSLFQWPRPAEQTVEAGAGRALDRAVLLVSLLRTAELRAEIVYASPTSLELGPGSPLVPLSRVLVLVPGIALEPSGEPLYVDPSRSEAWVGAMDESLLGVNALLIGETNARWLRLTDSPPLRRWAWSAAEGRDASFQVQVTGLLEGAPAARVRDWVAAGRPDDRPAALAFLRDLGPSDGIEVEETSGGRLQVVFEGTLSRAEILARDGTIRVPALPDAALGPKGSRFRQPRDAMRFDLEATESWTFRGLRSGTVPRTDEKSTPFWQVDSAASWSGPVFSRRYRLRFTARELAALAAGNVDAFDRQVASTLGGIKAPPAPR
jgi:hypothetical protein